MIPFVRLSIPSYETDSDNEGKYTVYCISIETGYSRWTVKRRYRQFASLHYDLLNYFNQTIKLPSLPQKKILGSSLLSSLVDERKSTLETYLNTLNSQHELINCPLYLDFLDSNPSSLTFQIKVFKMSKEITSLEEHCASLYSQLNTTNETLQVAVKVIQNLQERVVHLEGSSLNRSPGGYHDHETTSVNESMWEQHSSNKSHDESLSLDAVSPVMLKVYSN